ncbi:putative glutamate--cysteine ligase 2-3 [Sphaerisporangium krabiense]|uniref:Putative glutamate--cysteine ligase 2 n=1 Tax=Sphaerisporangium krabiense TaxID=763782 RepID=A0A7W9DT16_9ACTN|nr:glutamate--cysteine ligase [Sphaerisporangium krabiense]MBB5630158.1 carboxylate-amine ligase [Sphaerisporangium krabiense]GII65109.1 putative glutamate--cysteine ligase 2-3 [Sphaerisporangium krabiense]
MTVTVPSPEAVPFDATCPLMGVEEEYFVVDPATRAAMPRGAEVVRRAGRRLHDRVSLEFTMFQMEAKTPPCAGLPELERELRRMRAEVAAAAREEGLAPVATGTAVLGDYVPPLIHEDPRYAIGIANYRSLHDEAAICAGHVHVHLPDRERAVLVSNHLRPWLPVLIALMANSPFWQGHDTGYASYRTLTWGKWPVAGPPPYFSSLAEYEEVVAALGESGALVDPGTIFWDIRPSAHLPTLEVRVTDVAGTAGESALLAAIVRALVVVSLERVERGDHGPRLSGERLRVAYWRACRDGLDGHGIDPLTGRLCPAAELVGTLLAHIRPSLARTGDLAVVTRRLERLLAEGGGAARQRAAFAARGRAADVVDHLVASYIGPADRDEPQEHA